MFFSTWHSSLFKHIMRSWQENHGNSVNGVRAREIEADHTGQFLSSFDSASSGRCRMSDKLIHAPEAGVLVKGPRKGFWTNRTKI